MKFISGGQTGADRGGLEAARTLGIETGGWAAAHWMTENGPDNTLAQFDLQCAPDTASVALNYKLRTKKNIVESDATLIFCTNFTGGSKLTWGLCKQHSKPVLVVDPTQNEYGDVKHFLKTHAISVLNIAGNRESKSPGIFEATKNFLINLYAQLS